MVGASLLFSYFQLSSCAYSVKMAYSKGSVLWLRRLQSQKTKKKEIMMTLSNFTASYHNRQKLTTGRKFFFISNENWYRAEKWFFSLIQGVS